MKAFIKKNLALLSIVFVLAGALLIETDNVFAASGDTIVYITKTGECYHSSGCSSLSHSKIAVTLQSAVDNGYRSCKRCKPVKLDSTSKTTTNATASVGTNKVNTVTYAVNDAVEALKTYTGNTKEFNAYTYYINNIDLQTAFGADGDLLLKHFKYNSQTT